MTYICVYLFDVAAVGEMEELRNQLVQLQQQKASLQVHRNKYIYAIIPFLACMNAAFVYDVILCFIIFCLFSLCRNKTRNPHWTSKKCCGILR